MRHRTPYSILAALTLALHSAGAEGEQAAQRLSVTERMKNAQPLVIAHRGCWQGGPENSWKAISACIESGVEMAEIDIRTTKDGVMVLMHDETLDRTTNLSGAVKEHTYSELQRARLRVGHGGSQASLTDQVVPRFSDVLDLSKGRILLLLHVKDANYIGVYEAVARADAQTRVAFLVYAAPADPQLGLLGRSAYIPVIYRCGPARAAHCYTEDELRAERPLSDYSKLHPVAYVPISSPEFFKPPWNRSVRLLGFSYEDLGVEHEIRDPDSVWGQLLDMNASLILTDHATDVLAHLSTRESVVNPQVDRSSSTHVVVTWTASAPVDVYVSDRPDADTNTAKLLSRGDRDGRHVATVSDRRRSYFLLRDTADGTVVRVSERLVPLQRGSNFRDLGGYSAAGRKHVRWGLIYRSGATPLVSDRDITYIRALGLHSMIDLRSVQERELAPTRLAGQGIQYIGLDYPFDALFQQDRAGGGAQIPGSKVDGYRTWLTVLAPQYRALFQELLSQQGPVAYNCTGGQDRTGIASALILSALGVSRATILQDYHLSTTYRHPENEMPLIDPARYPANPAAELFFKARQAKPVPLYSSEGRSRLADTFDEIDVRWGSVENYLQQVLGVGPAELAVLRTRYLD